MNGFQLTHLTFTGSNVESASVHFGERVTVIHGPSDTGKSFIVDAVDFMLGAKSMKQLKQLSGYDSVELGLMLKTGERVALVRSTDGGRFSLYSVNADGARQILPDETLLEKHSQTKPNISTFLLDEIGLGGKRVRKNVNNVTVDMSFRFVAHLCVVGESEMQADSALLLSSITSAHTSDVSAFRVMIQGDDDSKLVPVVPSRELNKILKLQSGVIDGLIRDIELKIVDLDIPANLPEELEALNRSLLDGSARLEQLSETWDRSSRARQVLRRRAIAVENDRAESLALHARFDLLRDQYVSDLERLAILYEANDLLGLFGASRCAQCGALTEFHHGTPDRRHSRIDVPSVRESISAEERKTRTLLDDLIATMEVIRQQSDGLRGAAEDTNNALEAVSLELSSIESLLRPEKLKVRESLHVRSLYDRALTLRGQVSDLNSSKAKFIDAAIAEIAETPGALSGEALESLSRYIRSRLETWGVPNASTAEFSGEKNDVVLEGQERALHGKGVRALLHAAFTLGLAQHCFDRNLPHPGVVILDSPLVAYRAPDEKNPEGPTAELEGLAPSIVESFYRDMQENFDGQVVIVENTSPQDWLNPTAVSVQFTKNHESGRYGLFPVQS